MPTNHHFSKGTISEQYLYEDLIIEAMQIYGHDVYYLPRTLVNKDQLFGEDALSKFDDAYLIEMYMDTVEGYEGEKELVSRFGLEIRDETTFTVSRRRWLDLVSSNTNLITSLRPNEGDWIYFSNGPRLFEISFVDKDDPFFQVDNLPVYKLYARTVEYSDERLDTGITDIDAIEDKYSGDALQWQFLAEQSSTTNYVENITLERGTDLYATGSVELETATDGGTGILTSESETGFAAILTEDSNSTNSFFIINEEYSLATAEPLADNDWIEEAVTGTGAFSNSDPVLDFSERNPFGEPTESL
mgnify:FL=1|tara:strand:+ start:241 stop:1149 length:909 start_codon:yes stop_codon:yes gene_type:complete